MGLGTHRDHGVESFFGGLGLYPKSFGNHQDFKQGRGLIAFETLFSAPRRWEQSSVCGVGTGVHDSGDYVHGLEKR